VPHCPGMRTGTGRVRTLDPEADTGQVACYDREYVRNGTRDIFMFVVPLGGWRHGEVTEKRPRKDWAE
jgi:hypothetical protein